MGLARELVARQHQMIQRRELDGLADLYEPSGSLGMPGMRVTGPDLPGLVRTYLAAFPDLENQVGAWFEVDDAIALEQVVTGTHTGPLATPFGVLAPTGKRIHQETVEIVRVRGGKITSWTTYFDQLGTMLQLGVVVPGLR